MFVTRISYTAYARPNAMSETGMSPVTHIIAMKVTWSTHLKGFITATRGEPQVTTL